MANLDLFTPPGVDKLVLGTVDSPTMQVAAQYNPKELARQATAAWQATNGNGKKASGGAQALSWSGTQPQTMTIELLFDGVEENCSIKPLVETLIAMTEPRDMNSQHAWLRRPPLCVAVWGDSVFRCVVQSVQTKFTMFASTGEPLRATCTVALMEANVTAMWSADDHGADHSGRIASREHKLRMLSELE